MTPTTAYPVNLGMACPKGWEALSVLDSPDRAVTPLVRTQRNRLEPTDWDTALRTLVAKFRAIQREHGPESLAFISTGQMPTEEMALLGNRVLLVPKGKLVHEAIREPPEKTGGMASPVFQAQRAPKGTTGSV